MLAVAGGVWTISSACGVLRTSANLPGNTVILYGDFLSVPSPCYDTVCATCMTYAFYANGTLYYLSSADEQIRQQFDIDAILPSAHASMTGTTYKIENDDWLNVQSVAFGLKPKEVYHPMLGVGKQWSYLYTYGYIDLVWENGQSTMTMVEEGKTSYAETITDTVRINGKKYFVVKNLHTTAGVQPQVYMREDTIAQKVWVRPNEESEEQLLYSFDVAIGDTLRNITYYPAENKKYILSLAKYVVTNIYSTDGRKTIQLHAIVPYGPEFDPNVPPFEDDFTWIEGIGERRYGLSATWYDDDRVGDISSTSFLCVQQDGDLLYATTKGKEIGCEYPAPEPKITSLCDTWNVMVVENVTCGGCEDYRTQTHRLAGDTIIGSLSYRKLIYDDPRLHIKDRYEGALREGNNRDIYFIPAGTTHEYLLYDFNAKVGDKLENVWLGGSPVDSPDGYVLTVDSVSETTPRIYSLHAEIKFGDEETHTWSIRWVEGVGLSDGHIGAKRCLGCADSRGYIVLCAYKDEKQVYASDLSEEFGCYYDNTIDDTPLRLPSLCDEWNILREWFPDGLMRYDTHTERLTTDTIIGGQRYVKLEGREYRGALREGSNADIYIVPPHSTHEYLLYAFHAQVGDVLDNVWFGGSPSDFPEGCKTTITAIEEVNGYREFKLDVEYRLQGIDEYIHYSGYSWIDGVGLHAGASGSDCPLECAGDFGTSVLCAYKNGEQIYTSPKAEKNGCEMYMKPYFPDGMSWTYLAYPMDMDSVFYNEIRVQGEITYDDIVYQNIGGYPVRAIGKRIVARIDEVGEIPLYDFGLNVGESIVTFVPYNNGYYTTVSHKVTAVDSVMLLNGTQARRQTYDDGLIDIEYIGASTGEFFRRMDLFMPVVEGSYRYLCCSVGDELLYEFTPEGCSYDPYSTERADTVPLYVKDGPGSSTVDPVDPNEIVATLNGDELIIREYIGAEISFKLSKVSASNQAPARSQLMQSDSFRESVTITLTESGTYELELTNPEWNYSIVGTFVYMPSGVEDTPATTVPAQKVLMNGRLLIKHGDKVYTLTGMQVE